MKYIYCLAILFTGLMLPAGGAAAASETPQTIVCATLELRQCDANNPCLAVTPEEVDAPRLMRIDLVGKTVTASRADGSTWQSAIENLEEVDQKIIIQGAEDGSQDRRDGVGWTVTISKTTGRMSLAAAGDDVVFVGFGSCAAL